MTNKMGLKEDIKQFSKVLLNVRRRKEKAFFQPLKIKNNRMHAFGENSAGVPAFLAKLWRLVEDKDTNNLISWTADGSSFTIQNQAQFARELLPLNYKHNNMASFIRQLNMYGFHKVSSIDCGALKFDRDEMEFSHPCFKRDSPFLLEMIKRKIAAPKEEGKEITSVSKVLHEVKSMKGTQETFDSRLAVMKQENEALWREIASLRQKHMKQQHIVNKLITFLVSLVQPSRNMSGVKRHFQLMINDAPQNAKTRRSSETEHNGPVIRELTEELLEGVENESEMDNSDTITPNVSSPGGGTYPPSEHFEERPPSCSSYTSGYDGNTASPAQQQQQSQQSQQQQQQQQFENVIQLPNATVTYEIYDVPENQLQQMKSDQAKADTRRSGRKRKHSATEAEPATPQSVTSSSGSSNKKPIFIKSEKDIDDLLNLVPQEYEVQQPESSGTGTNTNTNSGNNNSNNGNQDQYIADNFISNDVPDDLFELSQEANDPMIGDLDIAAGNYNDKINLNPTSTTTKSSASSPSSSGLRNDLQLTNYNSPGKFLRNNEIMRLNSLDDVHTHLDGVQDNLDSLKDMLLNDGYSLDPNTLMGLFNDADILNPFLSISQSDLNPPENQPRKEIAYEPYTGDLTDMLNNSESDSELCKSGTDKGNSENSVLNTPLHK